MTTVHDVRSLGELGRLFAKHQRQRQRRITTAVRQTAKEGAALVRANVPVAFGELRESLADKPTRTGAKIEADAPHAAAVEVGSRPHTPPLEPLIAWVRLRAAQGLLSDRQLNRLPGTTTATHARAVAAQVRGMERDGAVDADAPRQIAFAIQQKIAQEGTLPNWFARRSLPAIVELLDELVRAALWKE